MRRRPSTPKGEQRREQILRTALRLFAEQSIEGTGLRQIAQEVGIAQPALYHYFKSKDELIDAVIVWRAEVMAQRIPERSLTPPKHQSLRAGLLDYLEHFHTGFADPDNIAIHRVMASEFARHSEVAAKLRRHFIVPQLARLEQLFAHLVGSGRIRDLAPDLLALQFLGPLLLMAFTQDPLHAAPEGMMRLVFQHLEVFIRGVEP